MRHSSRSLATAIPLVLAAFGMSAAAQAQTSETSGHMAMSRSMRHDAQDAQDRVNGAVTVVNEMKQDPHLARLLERSRGVFVIPKFGKGGLIIGGQGGGGVVLARHGERWSDPAFFALGGASIGAQAGGTSGAVAMILMTNRALDKFESSTGKWSLNAGAGLTVVGYAGPVKAGSENDVIVWAASKGLYGGLTANLTDITPESKLDHAYYREDMTSRQILTGTAKNTSADPLRDALLMRVATK